jgi:hypothetical protein
MGKHAVSANPRQDRLQSLPHARSQSIMVKRRLTFAKDAPEGRLAEAAG